MAFNGFHLRPIGTSRRDRADRAGCPWQRLFKDLAHHDSLQLRASQAAEIFAIGAPAGFADALLAPFGFRFKLTRSQPLKPLPPRRQPSWVC